jgi:hypothetical protein
MDDLYLAGVIGAFSVFAVTLFIVSWVVNSKKS